MPGASGEQDDAARVPREVAEHALQQTRARARARRRGVVAARGSRSLARRSREARTGSSLPFTATSIGSPRSKRCSSRRAVTCPTRIVPGLGGRLQSGGDVRRVAERDGLRVGASHEPDRCRAAVHSHSNGEAGDPPGGLDVARVSAHDLEDAKRRAGRALGVVLVRGRDAEVRADPVSLVGLHGAAVLVDRAAHHRHALADEHLRLVGLEPFAERGRADDVGEEHGDRAGARLPSAVGEPRRRAASVAATCSRSTAAAGASARDGAERVVLPQDRLLELPQLRGGLEAELVVEELSERPIRLEGVRMTTGAVERHHEQCAKALVERVEIDERLQLADRFGLAPHREHGLEASLERLESQALQPSDLRMCERLRGEVGERGAAPESERLGQARLGLGERLGREVRTSRRRGVARTRRRRRRLRRRGGCSRVAPWRARRRRRGADGASRRRPGRCSPRTRAGHPPRARRRAGRGARRDCARAGAGRARRAASARRARARGRHRGPAAVRARGTRSTASSLGDATTVDRSQAVLKPGAKWTFSGACDNGRHRQTTRRRGRWTSIRGRGTRSRGFATRSVCSVPATRCGLEEVRKRGDRRRRSRRSRRVVARLAAEARAGRGSGLGQGSAGREGSGAADHREREELRPGPPGALPRPRRRGGGRRRSAARHAPVLLRRLPTVRSECLGDHTPPATDVGMSALRDHRYVKGEDHEISHHEAQASCS